MTGPSKAQLCPAIFMVCLFGLAGCKPGGISLTPGPVFDNPIPAKIVLMPVDFSSWDSFAVDGQGTVRPLSDARRPRWLRTDDIDGKLLAWFAGTGMFQEILTAPPPGEQDCIVVRPKFVIREYVKPSAFGTFLSLATILGYNVLGGSSEDRWVECEQSRNWKVPMDFESSCSPFNHGCLDLARSHSTGLMTSGGHIAGCATQSIGKPN